MMIGEYARRRGVRVKTVREAIAAGRISQGADGLIDPEAADAEWEANTNAAKRRPGRPTTDPGGRTAERTLADARRREVEAKAARAEIELAKARGELLDRQAVTSAWYDTARAIRDALLNLPDRLAATVAGLSDPADVHEAIESEVRIVLESLSRDAPGA